MSSTACHAGVHGWRAPKTENRAPSLGTEMVDTICTPIMDAVAVQRRAGCIYLYPSLIQSGIRLVFQWHIQFSERG